MLYLPGYAPWLINYDCESRYNQVRCLCCVRDLDLRCYLAILGVIWNEC